MQLPIFESRVLKASSALQIISGSYKHVQCGSNAPPKNKYTPWVAFFWPRSYSIQMRFPKYQNSVSFITCGLSVNLSWNLPQKKAPFLRGNLPLGSGAQKPLGFSQLGISNILVYVVLYLSSNQTQIIKNIRLELKHTICQAGFQRNKASISRVHIHSNLS